MDIKTDSKTTIEATAFFDSGILKTHGCKIGDWWGEERCHKVDISHEIEKMEIPKGEYKITITLEKI